MSTTPIRTADKDANYLSYNADTIVWFAGTDQEREAIPGESTPSQTSLLPLNTKAWDAILKLSNRADTQLSNLKVAQGKEAAVDCNALTRDCILEGRFGVIGLEGEHVIKVKGGSHHLLFKGSIESTGTKADIVLGEWSDQSSAPVHSLDLSLLRHSSSRPLTVVVARVNSPIRTILTGRSPDIVFPANSRILKVRSLCELAYWHLKRVYVLLRYRRW